MAKKKYDADDDIFVAGEQFVEEFCTKPSYDEDGVQVSAGIGPDGKEYGDPVPMAPPVGFDNPPDLMTLIRTMVRSEQFLQRANQEDFDTFEEAGDFDVDDDPFPPLTPYEALLVKPPEDPPPVKAPAAEPAPQKAEPAAGGDPPPQKISTST